MKYSVIMPSWNDERLISVVLKHYETAHRIIFFDAGSTDLGPYLINKAGREIRQNPVQDKLSDKQNIEIKNSAWHELAEENDYIIIQDTDELIFFPETPNDILKALTLYKFHNVTHATVVSYAIIMSDDEWQNIDNRISHGQHPTLSFMHGCREDPICLEMNMPLTMYDKPMIFDPKAIASTNFLPGQHTWNPVFTKPPREPETPPTMLHCRYLGREREFVRTQRSRERLKHQFHLGYGIQYNVSDSEIINRIERIYNSAQNLVLFQNFVRVVPFIGANDFLIAVHDKSDFISRELMNGANFEPTVSAAVAFLCTDKSLFIDIGANIGVHTFTAAIAGADVISYECHPKNFKLLESSILANGWESRITARQYAISSDDSVTLKLSENSQNMGGSSLHHDHNEKHYLVSTKKIDSENLNTDKYERVIIKIDVEGHEPYVIKGMSEFLKNKKIQALFIEFNKSLTSIEIFLKYIYDPLISFGFSDILTVLQVPTEKWIGASIKPQIPSNKSLTKDELINIMHINDVVELIFTR